MSRSTRSARRSILSACARADGCRWSMPPVFPARCGGWCSPARLSMSPRRQNSRRWWPQFRSQAFEQMVQQGDGLVSGEHMLRFWNPPFSQHDVEAVLQRNLGDGSDEARMLLDRFERWDRATLDLPGTYYLEVTDRVFRQNLIAERPLCRARPQDRSRRGARAGLPAGREQTTSWSRAIRRSPPHGCWARRRRGWNGPASRAVTSAFSWGATPWAIPGAGSPGGFRPTSAMPPARGSAREMQMKMPRTARAIRGETLCGRWLYFAATTMISTLYCGAASLASTVARAGVLPADTQPSHTAFMSGNVFMSVM